MVAADGARVDHDVPAPQRHGVPLFNFEAESRGDDWRGGEVDGGGGAGGTNAQIKIRIGLKIRFNFKADLVKIRIS